MRLFYIACSVVFTMIFGFTYAQTDQEKAFQLGTEAIQLMDNGQINESIKLLEEAQKLDPESMLYPYEIAYAYYLQKDFQTVIQILTGIIDYPDANDQIFQMLGNSYSYSGIPEMALAAYAQGLEKFPHSGRLYLESGQIHYVFENYNQAISFWEQGIKAEPEFPSNYYWLAKIFASSNEMIWSLIYGELFMLLEPNTDRTYEISQLMYQNYLNSYTPSTESSGEFNLTENGFNLVINSQEELDNLNQTLFPFEGTFASCFAVSALNFVTDINLETIHQARQNFVVEWFSKDVYYESYSHSLIDFQKKLQEAGHMEAYNYWLISEGDYDNFYVWYEQNKDKFEAFADWYNAHPISLTPQDIYARTDY
jgi:tetratricopeptide (TPR) repeat protein